MERALEFQDGLAWRKWLEKHVADGVGIWLVIYRTGSVKKGLLLEEALDEALSFGWIDGKLKSVNNEKFILRFTTRKANSVWSKRNRDRAERLIAAGKMTDAGLAKIEQAKNSGSWNNAYTNLIEEQMPQDLEEALKINQQAWIYFSKFANTYRNMYIGWVNQAKTNETRQKRIKRVVEQSLANKKTLI